MREGDFSARVITLEISLPVGTRIGNQRGKKKEGKGQHSPLKQKFKVKLKT